LRILLVDDDAALRTLLRTTFQVADFELDEAPNARSALRLISRRRPDVIVLDVNMPGMSGLELCSRLKQRPATAGIAIALLTGSMPDEAELSESGADAVLRKPFSPLELLSVVERLTGLAAGVPFRPTGPRDSAEDALLLYARDLRLLLELERSHRATLEAAYLETIGALASALESKDTATRAHSHRVQRYASALAEEIDTRLMTESTAKYGFLLHDVGKIGIPDSVLQKPGPLTQRERRLMQTHTLLGEQMLEGVAYLRGDGLRIVRSHHERWDGKGYPDRLKGTAIPLGARVFAVADALDAMTSNRPYRRALSWKAARLEILREAGQQFDPDVVAAFERLEPELREIRRGLAAAA
jgi:response regulator RpfG family c-di-GMP phosphodiesterase